VRRHDIVISGLALLALVSLSACSPGVRPSSAASNEDTGQISAVQAPQNLPSTYTTQDGDTLMRVAARPEIYNDPDLWPLLKDANAESLVDKAADSPLAADITLEIPRDSTPEELEAARARARAFAAQRKGGGTAQALRAEAQSMASENGQASDEGNGEGGKSAAAAPSSQPTAATTPVQAPGSAHGSRMLPLYLLLLLVLAALAAVFFVFFRRDKQDFD
jgi:hypothetical protein